MESLGEHGSAIQFFVLAMASLLVLLIAKEAPPLGRSGYVLRVLGLILVLVLLGFAALRVFPGTAGELVLLSLSAVAQAVFMWWTVRRLKDIGTPRWWALLVIAPGTNVLGMIFFAAWPGNSASAMEPAEQ